MKDRKDARDRATHLFNSACVAQLSDCILKTKVEKLFFILAMFLVKLFNCKITKCFSIHLFVHPLSAKQFYLDGKFERCGAERLFGDLP